MEIVKRINEKHEDAYETAADQFSITMDIGVKANKIRFIMKAVQAGATKPTISDWLSQLATTITLAIGNKNVQKFSPLELYEYMIREGEVHGYGFIGDGTGADNHIGIFILDLPLCPMDKNMVNFMNKDYGFDGTQKVNITIEYPADANELDGRVLDVYAISLPDSNPTKVMEWESITKTYTATGEGQIMPLNKKSSKQLYEVIIKQTSYLGEGLTTDARTIEKVSYQELSEDVLFFDRRIEHFNDIFVSDSETTGVNRFDDQYVKIPFYHDDNAENSKQLSETSNLAVEVGVAEAVTWVQLRIAPLSTYITR